ncbi:MAG: hypothetical protein M3Q49_19245 [Actinomycetota bacterium]|nr:hypothetical protein [Actinomycetota bacterium]
MTRHTVPDAAAILGITEGAMRKRIARGTVRHERDGAGRVWVQLPDRGAAGQDLGMDFGSDAGQADRAGTQAPELVEELRDRISYLERQVEQEREARRRADLLLARFVERVPELTEGPQQATQTGGGESKARAASPSPTNTPPDGTQSPARSAEGTSPTTPPRGPQTDAHRPWWRRILGG